MFCTQKTIKFMAEYVCVIYKGLGRCQCLIDDLDGQTPKCTFFRLYENLSDSQMALFF